MSLMRELIFLHGWGASAACWKRQIAHFSARYQIIAPDLPGHGANRSPATEPILLPATSDQRPATVLIGWSYGGMLAIDLVARAPGRYAGLVLIGCSAQFTQASSAAGAPGDGLSPAIVKNIIRNLGRDYEATMRNCYGTFFSKGERSCAEEFIGENPLPDRAAGVDLLTRLLTLDLKETVSSLRIPALIIHGGQDAVCPLPAGIFLHEHIAGSALEVLPDAGHMPFYTRPAECNRFLEDFIGRLA